MPISSRITTGLLATLVLVGLGFIVRGQPSRDTEMLFGGRTLSEQELDSVEMSFSQAGLNDWQREGRRICIPIQSRSEYLAALSNTASLPVSIRSSVQDAIEKSTIFESSSQRLSREMHAKQQDLGNKITAFSEVRWASVDYDLSERDGLGQKRQQTASVVVIGEGGRALSPQRIADIQKLVSGSYAGMEVDDVVVVDTHANPIDRHTNPANSANPSYVATTDEFAANEFAANDSAANDPTTRRQRQQQDQIEQQLGELLSDYGSLRIAAYVELDAPSADQAKIPQPSISSNDASNARVRSNRATILRHSAAPLATDPSNLSTTITPSIPNLESSLIAVHVSIGLPQSVYQRVWNQLYQQHSSARSDIVSPPPTSAQLDQIRQQTQANIRAAVTPALMSLSPNQSRDSMIEIYDFPDVLASESPRQDFRELATGWLLAHWQQIALLILGFVGLSIAIKALGNAPSTAKITRPLADQVSPQPTIADDFSANSHRHERSRAIPVSATERELLTLIEQDPDAAVDVIQKWISEAA